MDSSGAMEERVLLTPVLGAHEEGPLCYLLEVDQTRILLDCGWNDAFDPALLEGLRKVLPTVDLILISFGDLEHMGALAYAVREFGLSDKCQIYATGPTKQLGLRTLYDAYLSRARVGEFNLFDLEDVDALEGRIKELTFGSQQGVQGKSVSPIVIDALCAGRILGGSMWRIAREPDVILYAVDFSNGRDTLLNGVSNTIDKLDLHPTLLITDAFNARVSSRDAYSSRTSALCERLLGLLRQNRNAIMPTDAAGRVLELLYVLNTFWRKQSLSYAIVWVTSVSSILDIARYNMDNYMNNVITSQFIRNRQNPFDDLEHVQVVHSLKQVHAIRDPKIILASSGTMEAGLVRDLLAFYGTQPGHTVLLTDKTMMSDSLSRQLVQLARQMQARKANPMAPANLTISFKSSHWEYKTGQELVLWKMQRKERLQAEARKQKQEEERRALQGDLAMDGMDVFAGADAATAAAAGGDVEGTATAAVALPGAADDAAEPLAPGVAVSAAASSDKPAAPAAESETATTATTAGATAPGAAATAAAAPANSGAAGETAQHTLQRQQSSFVTREDAARTGGGLYAVFAQRGDTARQMFSAFEAERTKNWDEYGEVINDADFLATDKDAEGSQQEGHDESDSDASSEEELEGAEGGPDGAKRKRAKNYGNPLEDALLPRDKRAALPRECVTNSTLLTLRCAVAYVDMESRATGYDSENIIKMLKPRKVLIVHGSEANTEEMVERCRKLAIQTILAPKVGETADVSSDVGMWRLELDRGLFDEAYELFTRPQKVALSKGKKRKTASDVVGIRYIEGVVQESEAAQVPIIVPVNPEGDAVLGRRVEPQLIHANVNRGDVLERLKAADEADGVTEADKIGAVLHDRNHIKCNSSVSVFVQDGGERLLVEGPVSKTFFKVRKLVYSCYERV